MENALNYKYKSNQYDNIQDLLSNINQNQIFILIILKINSTY